MPDREKVIKGLEMCLAGDLTNDENPCAQCLYFFDEMCQITIKKDAIALLREQEPVKSKWLEFEDGLTGQKYEVPSCGFCGTVLSGDEWYCPQCGKEVKWDDA